jgi:hypothetical protein
LNYAYYYYYIYIYIFADSSQFLRQARLSCAQRAADFCNEERVYFPLKAQTLESIFEDCMLSFGFIISKHSVAFFYICIFFFFSDDQVLNECTALFQSVEPSRAATPKSNQNPSSSNVSQRRLRELEQELLEARQEIESNEKRHQNTLAMWRSELDKYRGYELFFSPLSLSVFFHCCLSITDWCMSNWDWTRLTI